MNKRRIISGVLAGVMCATTVGVFSSCTGGSVGGAIHVAYAETGYGSAFIEQWKEEFEELNPEATVVLEGLPTMTAEVENRLRTGTMVPDVFIVLETGWQKMATSGWLEPLNDVYEATAYTDDSGKDVTIMEFMNPGMRDYGKMLDGNYYAIPWTDNANGIIYNKTLFEKKDWEVPETFDELVELCDTITADGEVAPFAILPGYGDYIAATWWAQYEGPTNYRRFFDYENPNGYLQEGRVEAINAMSELFFDPYSEDLFSYKKNQVPGVSEHTDAQRAFGLQQAAMIVEGAHLEHEGANFLAPDGEILFEYEMMPTPFLENAVKDANGNYRNIFASQAGDFMCIPKKANNVAGAKEFLKFINSKQGCESFTRSTNGAQRPFQYKASEVEGVNASGFMKSCQRIYESSEIVYHYSTSYMNWTNKLGKWPGVGIPYSDLFEGKWAWGSEEGVLKTDSQGNVVPQGVTVCQIMYDYVDESWWRIYESVV
ncbi:MAG: extracellular solute-binding protein [Clostridia bacterium]|nr:extracellular solute-binding protein [Clostridia bacterium]